MKSHLAKVSLALLCTAFLLGCQEQGSSPAGPEGRGPQFAKKDCVADPTHPGCKDDGGDPEQVTMDLADGMLAMDFDVGVSKDTRDLFKVSNHDFTKPTITMNFTDPGTCVGFAGTNGGTIPVSGDGTFELLVLQLTQDAADAKVVMEIDKTGLTVGGATTGGHLLLVQYDDELLGTTRIELGGPFQEVPPVTVKWTQPSVGQDVFEFTGSVVVWDAGGGIKNQSVIQCPGVGLEPNKVVATVNR